MLGLLSAINGQTYAISGTITNHEDGSPISKADVFIKFSSIGVKSDNNGVYKIRGLTDGAYKISVFSYGMQGITREVVIKGRDVRMDFRMKPLSLDLDEVTIQDEKSETFGITRLNAVEGTGIYEAKKNEVIMLEDITANLATNNSRQVYAKVAGLNIWESDGAGVQLGIGGRGLSPNRNSNFNTRQNGYDISADALGYPESYYTPPTQALERIEIVRGAASLQYGTQFGGMLNFVFKEGPEDKPIEVASEQTVGSFGLFSSFNSVGGAVGKVNYYSFYQYKRSDGWRPNSGLDQHTAYFSMRYQVTPKLSIRPEYTFMRYLAQQPGGLTDAQFEQDPRQSNRERNWFQVDWNLMALILDYKFTDRTKLNSRFFGLVAGRDALGNLGRIDRPDLGGERDFLSDDFRNWGNETRLMHHYNLLGNTSVFLVGTRYYDGFTDRKQGYGNDGDGPDFHYLNPNDLEGSDFDLPSKNIAVFAENIFNLTSKLSVTPGVRFEYINTEAEGYFKNRVKDLAGNLLIDEKIEEDKSNERSFVFFGIGASYKQNEHIEFYGNISQNYRAINFNDIRVNVGNLKVDPEISDERGFNADIGTRGSIDGLLNFDFSVFYLDYQDRIGTILRSEPDPRFSNLIDRTFRFRTNIADARIMGLETYAELDLLKLMAGDLYKHKLSVFSNLALIDAQYVQSEENGVTGNDVELVPEINLKTGLTFATGNLKATYQFSYVGQHFSDASNALETPTAIEGIIPGYHVMDLSLGYTYKFMKFQAGANNLSNNFYFTRRATGYPGPGIIPSDGRSFYLTLGARF